MATPKSTKERIFRKVRQIRTRKYRSPDLVGRVVPKKTGNNDPRHGGNRIDIQDAFLFVGRLMKEGNPGELIKKFPNQDVLLDIVDHYLAVSMGGWRREGDYFVNESGRKASPKNWVLKDDRLRSHSNHIPRFDTEKLHIIRNICEECRDGRSS